MAGRRQELARLSFGQRPQALFISCSDSRVQPSSMTGAEPGQVLELRMAGNVIPAYRPDAVCGVGATLEYALEELNTPDIIVCGHSHCDALRGLVHRRTTTPLMEGWLTRTAETASVPMLTVMPGPSVLSARAQQHVLVQLAHLRTYPVVARHLVSGRVGLHAWFYRVESGEVLSWRPGPGAFRPL
ncbi:carbonic anhydrase [Kitasatospora sp. NPDC057936]